MSNGFQFNYWRPKRRDTTASRWVQGHFHFAHCTINKILGSPLTKHLNNEKARAEINNLPCTLILPMIFLGFGATPSPASSEVCFTNNSSSDCNSTCRNLQIYYVKKSKHKTSEKIPRKYYMSCSIYSSRKLPQSA